MLIQSEVDALFAMPKKPKSNTPLAFPDTGGKLLAAFVSLDGREIFLFKGGYPLAASTPYMRIIAHTHTYYMLWSLASSGYPPLFNINRASIAVYKCTYQKREINI